jgi:hypothetical protein
MCEHGRRRSRCYWCLPIGKMMDSNQYCVCTNRLSPQRIKAKKKLCDKCDTVVRKRVGHVVRDKLLPELPHPPSALDDTMFGQTCDVNKRRRPDFMWEGPDRVVILEVDERGGHSDTSQTRTTSIGQLGNGVRGCTRSFIWRYLFRIASAVRNRSSGKCKA